MLGKLALVQTKELLDELEGRYDSYAFIGVQVKTKQSYGKTYSWKGREVAVGLLDFLKLKILDDIIDQEENGEAIQD